MNTSEFVTQWMINTIKEEYADDIALVAAHNTLRIDDTQQAASYFIPITDRGRRFEQTFILENEGFDVWGIGWERMERFAELREYNITCLADAEVLYARTPEDRERFEALKRQQAENLNNPVLQRAHALEAFARAKEIYLEMLFAQESGVKFRAGYVMDYLARAIAFSYGGYFKRAQTDQLAELAAMGKIPEGFAELYGEIFLERNDNVQKKQCYELIRMVERFLNRPEAETHTEKNFQDLADWYAELSYTWLRIRRYCGCGDVTKAYMWGAMLQNELNCVCEDFGLPPMELMCEFAAEDLKHFSAHADMLEQKMRQSIEAGGGKIREYQNREEFLNEIQKRTGHTAG